MMKSSAIALALMAVMKVEAVTVYSRCVDQRFEYPPPLLSLTSPSSHDICFNACEADDKCSGSNYNGLVGCYLYGMHTEVPVIITKEAEHSDIVYTKHNDWTNKADLTTCTTCTSSTCLCDVPSFLDVDGICQPKCSASGLVLNAAGNGCVAANAFQLIRVAPVVANATQPIVNKVEIALPATVTEVAYVTNTPQMITVTDVSTVYVGSTNCAEITISFPSSCCPNRWPSIALTPVKSAAMKRMRKRSDEEILANALAGIKGPAAGKAIPATTVTITSFVDVPTPATTTSSTAYALATSCAIVHTIKSADDCLYADEATQLALLNAHKGDGGITVDCGSVGKFTF